MKILASSTADELRTVAGTSGSQRAKVRFTQDDR
jgi:hypothetical protein